MGFAETGAFSFSWDAGKRGEIGPNGVMAKPGNVAAKGGELSDGWWWLSVLASSI